MTTAVQDNLIRQWFVQSCQERPSTCLNSDTFAVTMVAPILGAWVAIARSSGPIGLPAVSSEARRSPGSRSFAKKIKKVAKN